MAKLLLCPDAYRRAGLVQVRFPPNSGDLDPIETVWAQLRKDLASETPSLAAKYAPREKKQFAAFGNAIAMKLFPGGDAKARYRKAMARLTAKLDVPEVKMCGKRWAEIDVSAVPSRCLAKSRRGFLNSRRRRRIL